VVCTTPLGLPVGPEVYVCARGVSVNPDTRGRGGRWEEKARQTHIEDKEWVLGGHDLRRAVARDLRRVRVGINRKETNKEEGRERHTFARGRREHKRTATHHSFEPMPTVSACAARYAAKSGPTCGVFSDSFPPTRRGATGCATTGSTNRSLVSGFGHRDIKNPSRIRTKS
jgi:hypothetical protein